MFHQQQIRQQQHQYQPQNHQQHGAHPSNHNQFQQQQPRTLQQNPSQVSYAQPAFRRPMQRSVTSSQIPQQQNQYHAKPLQRSSSSNLMPQQSRQPRSHPQNQARQPQVYQQPHAYSQQQSRQRHGPLQQQIPQQFEQNPQNQMKFSQPQSNGAYYRQPQQQVPNGSIQTQLEQAQNRMNHQQQRYQQHGQQKLLQSPTSSPDRSGYPKSVSASPEREPQSAYSNPSGHGNSYQSPYTANNNNNPYGESDQKSELHEKVTIKDPYGKQNQQQQPIQPSMNQSNFSSSSCADTRFKKYNRVQEETYQEYKQRMRNEGTPLTRADRRLLNQNKIYQNTHAADDLNAPSNNFNSDDLNDSGNYVYGNIGKEGQEQEEDDEDEELEDIKCELLFTREKTVELTERTLAMARDAAMSGKNTLDMLSKQSQKLFGVEDNLAIAKVVNRQGTATAIELRTAGNLIRAPKNPFNKKSRLRKKEEEARQQMEADQEIRDRQREDFQASQRSLNQGLHGIGDGVNDQYGEHEGACEEDYKRYMFEGEGDEARRQEDRIANNLSEISMYANRLKGMAMAQGEEIDRQQVRIRNMQQNVNKLDVDVNRNTDRLRRIVS